MRRIHDLTNYEPLVANRPEYLYRYRHGNAYHPIHPFWLMYSCDYMLSRAADVILAGTQNPGVFRRLGITPSRNFADAWARAVRIVGKDPVTIVAPTYWSRRPFKFNVTK